MPNSKLPIQRASKTCDTSASSALPIRTRNTLPATSWARRLSLRSASKALIWATPRARGDAYAAFAFPGSAKAVRSLCIGCGRGVDDGRAIEFAQQLTVKIRLGAGSWCCKSRQFELFDFGQDAFDFILIARRKRGLWRHRIANRIALHLQPSLDAGGEIKAGESLVDTPKFTLKFHGIGPLRRATEFIEPHALARHDAGRSRHPADAADQHHGCWNVRRGREYLNPRRTIHDG